MSKKAYSIKGTLYVGLLDSNYALVSGYKKFGEVYPFTMNVTTAKKELKSRMKATAGQTRYSVTRLDTVDGKMTCYEIDDDTMAYLLAGTATTNTGTSGTVTDEAVTTVHDEWVNMAQQDISTVVVQDVTDTTTYALGTDYELNLDLGMIKVLSTGTILNAAVLHVDYAYAAQTGATVTIGDNPTIRVAMLLDGENEVDNTDIRLTLDSVVISSETGFNFITEPDSDFEAPEFNLAIETLEGQTSPGSVNGLAL